jgi:hypothetical protein
MSQHTRITTWFRLAVEPHTLRRGLAYAFVVGALLIGINHYEVLIGEGTLTGERLVKMGLTVLVPYLVSTFSSVGAQLACGRSETHSGKRGAL